MIKTTIIKAQTVAEATRTYGEETVQNVFELIRNNAPKDLFAELEDGDLKKCLFFLLNGDIN
jgi:hypothetical protein